MLMVLAWLRLELRRRWRALVVLALLVALSAGTVIGAVAGARRGATAIDRLLDRTLPATVVAQANQVRFDWAPVRALPEVAALTTFPPYSGFGVEEAPSDPVGAYLPADAEAMRTVERPVILAGRLADPRRADEAVVTQGFVDRYRRGVGSTVTVRLFSAQQVNTGVSAVESYPPPRPQGPAVRTRIVGVVRSPFYRDAPGDPGRLIPSAGLFAAYPASLGATDPTGYELWALVRLVHGNADIPRFRADLARIAGRNDVEVTGQSDRLGNVRDVASFDAVCLLVFAVAALLAALVLVGQAIVRYCASTVADLHVLRGLGLTRGQGVAVAVAGPAVAAVGGTVAGLGAAVLASSWMPFGAAATVEPSPGVDADWLVLGLGGLVTVLLVLAGAAVAARFALAGFGSRRRGRASVVAQSAHRAGLPVPVVVGARFALEPGAGAGSVRSALSGSVVGVMGILAAFTLSAGVSDASTNPARFGLVHQVETAYGFGGMNLTGIDPQVFRATLAADRDVSGTLNDPFAVAETAHRSVITFNFGPDAGWPGMVLTAGQPPTSGTDVVLAPTTARALRAGVGSTVTFAGQAGTAGDTRTRTLRVTGLGFVPQTPYNEYDSGAWVAPAGYQALFGGYNLNWDLLITLRRGADPGTVIPRLHRALEAAATSPAVLAQMRATGMGTTQNLFLSRAAQPQRIEQIRDIRVLPLMLGVFLALLAAGVLGHALTTTMRRRCRDVAALRAVGMTRRQSAMIALTQATVLAIVGLALGVPLGTALGRVLWRAVADSTPLAYRPPVAVLALALVAPAVLLAVNLIAAPAARRTVRLRIADVLRSE